MGWNTTHGQTAAGEARSNTNKRLLEEASKGINKADATDRGEERRQEIMEEIEEEKRNREKERF